MQKLIFNLITVVALTLVSQLSLAVDAPLNYGLFSGTFQLVVDPAGDITSNPCAYAQPASQMNIILSNDASQNSITLKYWFGGEDDFTAINQGDQGFDPGGAECFFNHHLIGDKSLTIVTTTGNGNSVTKTTRGYAEDLFCQINIKTHNSISTAIDSMSITGDTLTIVSSNKDQTYSGENYNNTCQYRRISN